MRRVRVLALCLIAIVVGARAGMAAGCLPIADDRRAPPGLQLAAAGPQTWQEPSRAVRAGSARLQAALPERGSVRLSFLGHSSFLIETPAGVSAVTDYNGYYQPPLVPTIVTMNNAHSSHYASSIDPGVKHVLRGWAESGGWAEHDIEEGDLRVRNIPTAVRGRGGDQALSNSIFVFETADLCIAHLGHLHHVLTKEQVAELGQIDILLVPIDGGYTMAQELMVEVIEQVRPALVIPMHYFGSTLVGRFAALIGDSWEVQISPGATVTLSRADLPYRQMLVLPGD